MMFVVQSSDLENMFLSRLASTGQLADEGEKEKEGRENINMH